ncbi:NAD(P)/FAD-dependent oxidoreductase [Marinobacter sp.]|uniref:NAD(P)/FAD-dependent oxidoreductase n=1 Tax=Marinobacter sp. TaxID=50741 RepID=UPI003569E0C2
MIDTQDSQTVIRRLAIVGSGLAGLTAARKLAAAGVDVTLFEKSRGPGGRMASKRLSKPADSSADIGAQYFTIRNPAFRQFLTDHAGTGCWGTWGGRFRYQGADNGWQSMRPAERYVGIPRMSAITRSLSSGLAVRAGVRIASLDRDGDDLWRLTDTEGRVYEGFDTVLLTPPPAQTIDLLKDSGLSMLANDFNLQISRMQACWTVMAYFPEGAGADFEALMPNSPLLNWAANNSSKPGRQDEGEWWVLHGDPDWSDANTEAAPDQVADQLLKEFHQYGDITAAPGTVNVHRWLYARPKARTGPGHLWFQGERIAIAGDWLDGGRVEGAFNSADGLVSRLASLGLVQGL